VGTPLLRPWRGRGLRWAATVVLAVLAGALAAATVDRAEQARAAYGVARRVPVATTDLGVGEAVGEADVEWADLPVALIPEGAADDPVGRIVVEPLVRGEVVLDRRLSTGGTGPGALLAPGDRALAVPLGAGSPSLSVGDRVDLFAPSTSSADLADVARGRLTAADRVAKGSLVISVDDTAATIGVGSTEAAGVAGALLDGTLVLALVAPG
jgi:Flp pilus assembly protein CpaB